MADDEDQVTQKKNQWLEEIAVILCMDQIPEDTWTKIDQLFDFLIDNRMYDNNVVRCSIMAFALALHLEDVTALVQEQNDAKH